ncbi:uncharacterized protein B0I36DRAFT_422788 [Microdochium trichocladiopsis]|uniref:DUF1446 domain-containing protein n=1 Tax=Microdochium trichocladiopsis TaxID=1682393 RepID=A0A9P8Y3B1_9PEZI|nr:uncharacterized protein B0I36DRAFT_422788 [Microdochium trichocladiopsis]KAH7028953.1 hypothetical protein B0I36DRAFT_422788 [Microdochium trichocladiopsis]
MCAASQGLLLAPSKATTTIRIANCSGATPDPGQIMLTQATAHRLPPFGTQHHGSGMDVITGDYLAEANLAENAEAFRAGRHPGWVASALTGIELTLGAVFARQGRLKIIVNGGGLNPRGLALRVQELVDQEVAYVDGDDLLADVDGILRGRPGEEEERARMLHLDDGNEQVCLTKDAEDLFGSNEEDDTDGKKEIVAANAYLGCRAIRTGLELGADIIICGRVADASPVMAAAQWWHGWEDSAYDELAGALVAGHLIECSTYGTGANFAGFDDLMAMPAAAAASGPDGQPRAAGPERLWDLGCPIAEIDSTGECVITKHESLNGFVTEEVVKCQLLYELQGNIYLNSDVKADLHAITVQQVGPNRVHVRGAQGHPPPPTTKLAVFYKAGWQGEMTVNGNGYAVDEKYALQELQVRRQLAAWGKLDCLDVLEFQRVGVPARNPRTQLAGTTALRIFAQASDDDGDGGGGGPDSVRAVVAAWSHVFMQHFPGMHCSLDLRLMAVAVPFLGYFPAVVEQSRIAEAVNLLGGKGGEVVKRVVVGPPKVTERLVPRLSYDTMKPCELGIFGPTETVPLGDILLARSGDKGANVNVGFTPRARLSKDPEVWEWMQSYLTTARMKEMMGDDWKDEYHVERVEFADIRAVHYVVYDALGRGVSSSARLDSLGKGFAEWLRAVHAPVPIKFLKPRLWERSRL